MSVITFILFVTTVSLTVCVIYLLLKVPSGNNGTDITKCPVCPTIKVPGGSVSGVMFTETHEGPTTIRWPSGTYFPDGYEASVRCEAPVPSSIIGTSGTTGSDSAATTSVSTSKQKPVIVPK